MKRPAFPDWQAAIDRARAAYDDDMAVERGWCATCHERPHAPGFRVCYRCRSRAYYAKRSVA